MRLTLLIAMGAALSVMPAAPASAVANNAAAETVGGLCQDLVDQGAYDSVGQCASEIRTGPVRFCQFLKNLDIFPIYLYDPSINDFRSVSDQGQCVSLIRQF